MGQFADDFPLPPAAADVPVTFTVDKDLVPYALEWFTDTQRPGESVNDFMNRAIAERAIAHRQAKLLGVIGDTVNDLQVTETEQINNDATAALDAALNP